MATITMIADQWEPRVRAAVLRSLRAMAASSSVSPIITTVEAGASAAKIYGMVKKLSLQKEATPAIQALAKTFQQGQISGAKDVRGFKFDIKNPAAEKAALSHGAKLVKDVTKETKSAIATLVSESQKNGVTPANLASDLRAIIGLNSRDAAAVARARQQWTEAGMDSKSIKAAVEKLTAKKIRQRAVVIARTESIRAASYGRLDAWKEAQGEGLLPKSVERVWIPSPDACPEICLPLAGQRAGLDESFGDDIIAPPAHPQCRCSTGLVFA